MENKKDKPICYTSNNDSLCKGIEHFEDFLKNYCTHCCLYENMFDDGGYSYYYNNKSIK